jgi:transcriptional regulator with XRE-family HTH domain
MAPKVESLAEYLRDLRLAAGLTLRDVEEQSENTVSNGYLSQLESGQAKRPAPNVLHALAKVYGASYQRLMELAGYLGKSERTDKGPTSCASYIGDQGPDSRGGEKDARVSRLSPIATKAKVDALPKRRAACRADHRC